MSALADELRRYGAEETQTKEIKLEEIKRKYLTVSNKLMSLTKYPKLGSKPEYSVTAYIVDHIKDLSHGTVVTR
jgi:hypothetical protein